MHLVCPHCQNPIELISLPASGEVLCGSCGSTFRVEADATVTWGRSDRGRKLGRFELQSIVGTGAFGTVYRARDPKLDRTVAVKIPRAGNLPDGRELDRFLREARSAAQLRHPAIVPVYEVGQDDGLPYLISEFVEGVTLADRLTAGRPSYREAAELIATIAEALDCAHRSGIIHRDVKPSNIMIRPDGTPVVMDFGLAKRDAGEITMTTDGQVLGTPAYMSPEQARGEGHTVDGRSDVYSLGVILYHLLTGELPFRGNARMLLHQVLHDDPRPPRSLNDRVPRDLETICLRAMAKEPARRYATAAALAEDLRRYLVGEPIAARPVGRLERLWRWARRNPALAVACGLAAVGLAGATVTSSAYAWAQSRAAQQQLRAAGELRQERDRTRSALGDAQRFSADLTRALAESKRLSAGLALERGLLLCNQDDPGRGLLWMAQALQLAPQDAADIRQAIRANLGAWGRRISPLRAMIPGNVFLGTFSPDGQRYLAPEHDGTLRFWDVESGMRVGLPLRHDGSITSVQFSADGRSVAAAADKTVWIWDAATGERRAGPLEHRYTVLSLAFSPDGKTLLTGGGVVPDYQGQGVTVTVDGKPVTDRPGEARLWDVDGGMLRTAPLAHPSVVGGARFGADGATVVTSAADLMGTARLWDAATGRLLRSVPDPKADRDPNPSAARPSQGEFCSCWSPDGRRVATVRAAPSGGDEAIIRIVDLATGARVGPFSGELGRMLAFSPDSKILAVGSGRVVRLYDASTGSPVGEPLSHGAPVWDLAFSPDSQRLATCNDLATWLWDISPGRMAAPTMIQQGSSGGLRFSPDGSILLTFSGDPGIGFSARLWEAATGRPLGQPLPHSTHREPAFFSPGGSTILTTQVIGMSQDNQNLIAVPRLWSVAKAPSADTVLHCVDPASDDGASIEAISRVGKVLLTSARDRGIAVAQLWDLATGRRIGGPLTASDTFTTWKLSPDGGTVVAVWETRPADPFGAFDSYADKTLGLWDGRTGQPIGEPRSLGSMNIMAFSPDSKTVVVRSQENLARIMSVRTGQCLGPPMEWEKDDAWCEFSPDGAVIAFYSDRTIRFWDAATGKPLAPPLRHDDQIQAYGFSPDETTFWNFDGSTVRRWDARDGRQLGEPVAFPEKTESILVSPDKTIALVDIGPTSQTYDLVTWRPIGPPLLPGQDPSSVHMTPDRSTLLISYGFNPGETYSRLWDVTTGRSIGRPIAGSPLISGDLFSPDSTLIVVNDDSSSIRLYDTSTAQPVGPPLSAGRSFWAWGFIPDGRILTRGPSGTVHLWNPPTPVPGDASAVGLWARVITGLELDADGVIRALDAARWDTLRRELNQQGAPSLP